MIATGRRWCDEVVYSLSDDLQQDDGRRDTSERRKRNPLVPPLKRWEQRAHGAGGVLKFSELIIGGMFPSWLGRTTIIIRVDAKVKRFMLAAKKGFNEIPATDASPG